MATKIYLSPLLTTLLVLLSIFDVTSISFQSLNAPQEIADKLRYDTEAIESASTDYGLVVRKSPAAVFYPDSIRDIERLIKFAFSYPDHFPIAVRGQGHSTRGQAFAENGIVISNRNGAGIIVYPRLTSGLAYVDAGGDELWIAVLMAALDHGLTPVSWTDYLYLSVGGTLSNGGISGQTFRFGPQICNVYELDVITGKGDHLTCSPTLNSELFYAVLGGLGQFGIITRARIALTTAPTVVKWVRMLYSDFSEFSEDQEHLIISTNKDGQHKSSAINYVEGFLLFDLVTQNNNSFFSVSDQPKILSLINRHRVIYCMEIGFYYDDLSAESTYKEVEILLKRLRFVGEFVFEKDVTYYEFINRVGLQELELRAAGLTGRPNPHPWLNLFIPKSQILEFDSAVFKGILLERNLTTGLFLFYPMLREKWDDRMSAVTPDAEVFYTAGLLFSSGFDNLEAFEIQDKEIMNYCARAGIEVKQYLPRYDTKADWETHFGSKWKAFEARKSLFDPHKMLSPGLQIFNQGESEQHLPYFLVNDDGLRRV